MSPVYGYVFNLFLVLVLVFCNAFFVVSEFAIVKIRRTKLEELAHAGSKRAKIALKINEHMNTYLSAIQLGITLASLGLGWRTCRFQAFGRPFLRLFCRQQNPAPFFEFWYCLYLYHAAARCFRRTGAEVHGHTGYRTLCADYCAAAVYV